MNMTREYNILHKGMRIEGENRRFYSSGQMFIIASILIVTALLALKNLLGVYSTFEEKRFEETLDLDSQLKNIKNEFGYILGIAALQNDVNGSGIRFFYNFSNFIANDIDARILYVFVFVNSSNQAFGVTTGNLLREAINVTINATNSTPTGYTFIMNSSFNTSREFQSSINGTINITLTYSRQNSNITERFPILVSTIRSAAIFVDARVHGENAFVRAKEIYNKTW